jgi:hypothetical protein
MASDFTKNPAARLPADPASLCEKAIGAKMGRCELQQLLKTLAPGDVVTVTRMERPAHSTFDLFSIIKPTGGRKRKTVQPHEGEDSLCRH